MEFTIKLIEAYGAQRAGAGTGAGTADRRRGRWSQISAYAEGKLRLL